MRKLVLLIHDLAGAVTHSFLDSPKCVSVVLVWQACLFLVVFFWFAFCKKVRLQVQLQASF